MNDEQAIRKLVSDWLDASRRHDIDRVLDLMSDDVIFMTAGSEPFGKAEFAERAHAMKSENIELDAASDIQEIQIGDGWAWLRNYLRVTVKTAGCEPVSRTGYTLTILRRNASGQWVIVRDANLMRP